MNFKVGDVIAVTGTVVSVNSDFNWIIVQTKGGGIFTVAAPGSNGAELVSRPRTPGQRAFERWLEGRETGSWKYLTQPERDRWEQIAGAARD